MAHSCKGICIEYIYQKMKNSEKYNFCKRCTYCGIFLRTDQIHCPCCGIILRTKPRNKKIISEK